MLVAALLTSGLSTLGTIIPALGNIAPQCILLPTLNAGICSLLLEVPFRGISQLTPTRVANAVRGAYLCSSLPWLIMQTTHAYHLPGASQTDALTPLTIALFPACIPVSFARLIPGLMLTLMLMNSRVAPSLASAVPTQALLDANDTSNYSALVIIETLLALSINLWVKAPLWMWLFRKQL
jgi:hypothetical protein